MTRLLFVDDEPHVLRGLQRLLACLEEGWEIGFASSGQQALDIMAQKRIDVLITDMHMPGMDGAELLERVSRAYPDVVRIVLSGQADRASVLRAVSPMHQYLAKPCSAEMLQATIKRALALHERLSNPQLRKLVTGVISLPSLPSLYVELVRELESPSASCKRAGEIIAQDVGMTAKILQLTNSAVFGIRRRITSPEQAIALLGIETVRSLVLTIGIFSQFNNEFNGGFSVEKLMAHSTEVGRIAAAMASDVELEGHEKGETFTAGLLHDVGKLLLAANMPNEYAEVLDRARNERIPLIEAEQEILGTSHDVIGAHLLGIWGLPESIVEATAFHHGPDKCPHDTFRPLTLVYAANLLVDRREPAADEPAATADGHNDYLARLGLDDQFERWAIAFGGREAEVMAHD